MCVFGEVWFVQNQFLYVIMIHFVHFLASGGKLNLSDTFQLFQSNRSKKIKLCVRVSSVPCEPENVTVEVQCETSSVVLSWNASEGAVGYVGCAETDQGDMLYCNTMDTSCSIQGLGCGSTYNFSVQATDGVCNSSFSPPEQRGAGKHNNCQERRFCDVTR